MILMGILFSQQLQMLLILELGNCHLLTSLEILFPILNLQFESNQSMV